MSCHAVNPKPRSRLTVDEACKARSLSKDERVDDDRSSQLGLAAGQKVAEAEVMGAGEAVIG